MGPTARIVLIACTPPCCQPRRRSWWPCARRCCLPRDDLQRQPGSSFIRASRARAWTAVCVATGSRTSRPRSPGRRAPSPRSALQGRCHRRRACRRQGPAAAARPGSALLPVGRQQSRHALGLGREPPEPSAAGAQGLLANLLQAAPFQITPILTDNG